MAKNTELFYKSVEILLNQYSSNKTSQATRLVGFIAGLFTVIQTVGDLQFTSSGIELFPFFKFIFLVVITEILILLIIRTIFRFGVFAYFSDYLIRLKPTDIDLKLLYVSHLSLLDIIQKTIMTKIKNSEQKLYGFFPLLCFHSVAGNEKQYKKGLKIVVFLTFLATILMMLFLL